MTEPELYTATADDIRVDIHETGWKPWFEVFKRHHYLPDAGPMAFSTAYTGFVGEEAVAFVGVSGHVAGKRRIARFCRMVVKPEWQGAGIGIPFLEFMCERELRGEGFIGAPVPSLMHTAHPALCHVLRRSPRWRQVSGSLHGQSRADGGQWGKHLRSVSGFKYYGARGEAAAAAKKAEGARA